MAAGKERKTRAKNRNGLGCFPDTEPGPAAAPALHKTTQVLPTEVHTAKAVRKRQLAGGKGQDSEARPAAAMGEQGVLLPQRQGTQEAVWPQAQRSAQGGQDAVPPGKGLCTPALAKASQGV